MNYLPSPRQKAFTLIELIVVIVLVGVLSVTASFRWPKNTMALDTTIEQLAKDIQFTQALAMSGQAYNRINFAADHYSIKTEDDVTPYSGYANIPFDSAITLSGNVTELTYNALGVPYNGGVPLAGDATITLSINGESKQITVTPETGNVSLS